MNTVNRDIDLSNNRIVSIGNIAILWTVNDNFSIKLFIIWLVVFCTQMLLNAYVLLV